MVYHDGEIEAMFTIGNIDSIGDSEIWRCALCNYWTPQEFIDKASHSRLTRPIRHLKAAHNLAWRVCVSDAVEDIRELDSIKPVSTGKRRRRK